MLKGNHDYWWTTVTNLNKLYNDMKFLQTNFYEQNYCTAQEVGTLEKKKKIKK